MYESFYGLKEKPFNLLPDPQYLYMSEGHENAFTHLEYAVAENKGFVVVTGEIGSGKTTLINFLLEKISQNVQIGIINNTDITPDQLFRMVCQEFELDVRGKDKAEMLEMFNRFLLDQFARGSRVVLIVDEAQNLPKTTLEEIRMLSNLEGDKHHLIQIILVGQPELRAKLQTRGLEQLVQRVTVHCHLNGLNRADVERYIRHRLVVAGAHQDDIFDAEAMDAIYEHSKGIPRLINILCDTAMVYGYADEHRSINRAIVEAVVKARQIGPAISEDLDESATADEPVVNSEQYKSLAFRYETLERRLFLLENTVANIDQRVQVWFNKKEEKENGLMELVKLLKDSLAGRQRVTNKYLELKRTYEAVQREKDQEEKEIKASMFSRLTGRGRNR